MKMEKIEKTKKLITEVTFLKYGYASIPYSSDQGYDIRIDGPSVEISKEGYRIIFYGVPYKVESYLG